ncbi:hypothetical protein GGR56DRAFT_644716 [Xylariaceae sp. FL0804]|nr:hypothetical protein GGR56DRAFT_644716 [Xylariaceae sp. FL0804]
MRDPQSRPRRLLVSGRPSSVRRPGLPNPARHLPVLIPDPTEAETLDQKSVKSVKTSTGGIWQAWFGSTAKSVDSSKKPSASRSPIDPVVPAKKQVTTITELVKVLIPDHTTGGIWQALFGSTAESEEPGETSASKSPVAIVEEVTAVIKVVQESELIRSSTATTTPDEKPSKPTTKTSIGSIQQSVSSLVSKPAAESSRPDSRKHKPASERTLSNPTNETLEATGQPKPSEHEPELPAEKSSKGFVMSGAIMLADAFKSIVDLPRSLLGRFVSAWTSVLDQLMAHVVALTDLFKSILDLPRLLLEKFSSAWTSVLDRLMALVAVVTNAFQSILDLPRFLREKSVSAWASARDQMMMLLRSLWSSMASGLRQLTALLGSFCWPFVSGIRQLIRLLVDYLRLWVAAFSQTATLFLALCTYWVRSVYLLCEIWAMGVYMLLELGWHMAYVLCWLCWQWLVVLAWLSWQWLTCFYLLCAYWATGVYMLVSPFADLAALHVQLVQSLCAALLLGLASLGGWVLSLSCDSVAILLRHASRIPLASVIDHELGFTVIALGSYALLRLVGLAADAVAQQSLAMLVARHQARVAVPAAVELWSVYADQPTDRPLLDRVMARGVGAVHVWRWLRTRVSPEAKWFLAVEVTIQVLSHLLVVYVVLSAAMWLWNRPDSLMLELLGFLALCLWNWSDWLMLELLGFLQKRAR